MWKASLGVVVGALLAATSSCGDSSGSDDDDDAGAGGSDAGKGGAGRGGTMTAGSGRAGRSGAGASGRGSVGGAGPQGGSAGKGGGAGQNPTGQSGEAGSPGVGGGSGGTMGEAGTSSGSGAGGEGGGEVSTRTGCERDPKGDVLVDADFSTDIFVDSAWTRSDSSVELADGIVTIDADGGSDDYVGVDLTGATLPVVVELRQRSNEPAPINEVLPVNEFYFDGVWLNATYLEDSGWMLSNSAYSGDHTNAPEVREWITLRVLLDTEGSELCAKKDGDTAFTRVITSDITLPDTLFNVHVRQAWDYRSELSTLRIQRP